MNKLAFFSPCETYRYTLERSWDTSKGYAVFVGLNPSTADEKLDDPTIRRCVRFAERFGCGALMMVNLFAFRATDPRELRAVHDPVGPLNDEVIAECVRTARVVVAAWGVHGVLHERAQAIAPRLGAPMCLGYTKDGHPRHPLYVRADAPLVPFRFATSVAA